jgi:hypothetical protein
MAISIVSMGSGTITHTNNDYSSVTIADAAATLGDIVLIQPTSVLPKDLMFNHTIYVSAVTGDGFTVKSSYPDMVGSVTFDYIIIHEA